MAIIVTGTPGTGKTTIARMIAKKLMFRYIDTNKIIKKKRLSVFYDKKRKTKVVDEKKLAIELIKIINRNDKVVVDGHLSHFIPRKRVSFCIVTRCDLNILRQRLEKRRYNKEKIRENLDAELFEVILNEALERKHNVYVIDTSNKKSISKSSFPF